MAYVAQHHPPTSTRYCSLTENGLVAAARVNRLELFDSEGSLVRTIHLHSRIAGLASVGDSLLVVTDTLECRFLKDGYEEVVCISDTALRRYDEGPLVRVNSRCIGVYAYHGVLACIPRGPRPFSAQALRLAELNVVDFTFVGDFDIAILYKESLKTKVKRYSLQLDEGDLTDPQILAEDLDPGASLLIPLKNSLLVLGHHSVTLIPNEGGCRDHLIPPSIFTSWTKLDSESILLATECGSLFRLVLSFPNYSTNYSQTSPTLIPLGRFSVADSLLTLSPTRVFLASHFGDSLFLDIESNCPRVIAAIPNIAPISDFQLHSIGSSTAVVSCSGGYSDGAVKVIKSGIALDVAASVDLPGINAIFPLGNSLLVLAFAAESRVLKVDDNSLEMVDFDQVPSNSSTILATSINNSILHITPFSVTLSKPPNTVSWTPKHHGFSQISHASANNSLVVIAAEGSLLTLSLDLNITNSYSFPHEISCLALTTDCVVVGLWTCPSVHILPLDSLTPSLSEPLDSVPRSVALLDHHLIVALGDGKVLTIHIANKHKKSLHIAHSPVSLQNVLLNTKEAVWASSERPGVFTSSAGKISWSPTNIPESSSVANFQDALVISTSSGLLFATVESAQKVHLKSFPINALPRRLVFAGSAWALAVVALNIQNETGQEYQSCSLELFSEPAFSQLDAYELDQDENITAVNWIKHKIFVGTGYTLPDQDESTKGRILLFEVNREHKLRLLTQTHIEGTCYALEAVQGRIVCTVNSFLHIYDLVDSRLFLLSTLQTPTLSLSISIHQDLILVGDLMKSVAVYKFNPTTSKIEMLAKDYGSLWMTSTLALDQTTFLGADADGNIVLWKRDIETSIQEQKHRLEIVADFRIGEMVNQIRRGSLTDSTSIAVDVKAVYATVDGSIGIFGLVKDGWLEPLLKLQQNLQTVTATPPKFRAFSNDRRTMDSSRRVIDGDIIERFLELDANLMKQVVLGGNGCDPLNLSIDQVSAIVEELGRLK